MILLFHPDAGGRGSKNPGFSRTSFVNGPQGEQTYERYIESSYYRGSYYRASTLVEKYDDIVLLFPQLLIAV